MTMTGAELKTTLGGLGLTPAWFADRMNCTMRTVVRWFDSDAVSYEVVEELERVSNRTVDEMQKMIDDAVTVADVSTLFTYRTDEEFVNPLGYPASWHRQLTFRVKETWDLAMKQPEEQAGDRRHEQSCL